MERLRFGIGLAVLLAGAASGEEGPPVENSGPPVAAAVRSVAVTRDGVAFEAVVPGVWPRPRPGGPPFRFEIELRLTNRTGGALRFLLFDTIRPRLATAGGAAWPAETARDATARAGRVSEPIAPGSTCVVRRAATFETLPDGTSRLVVADGFGGQWWFDGPPAGKLELTLLYDTPANREPGAAPTWQGKAATAPIVVTVR